MKKEHNYTATEYKCSWCHKVYGTLYKAQQHRETKHQDNSIPIVEQPIGIERVKEHKKTFEATPKNVIKVQLKKKNNIKIN
jgi:hypothetical protein